ncbi:MAG: hypothetical protein IJT73_03725 [Selenomonadaceae bacterium]|nr:hypothetical protein [Selenomonadaceae bacterium]
MLKKFLLAAFLIFSLQATAQANNIVKIVNETHKSITEIYLAPTGSEDWLLHSVNYLRDGESTNIYVDWRKFKPQAILRYFDIGVNYDDFTQKIWYGIDISNISEIKLLPESHSVTFKTNS